MRFFYSLSKLVLLVSLVSACAGTSGAIKNPETLRGKTFVTEVGGKGKFFYYTPRAAEIAYSAASDVFPNEKDLMKTSRPNVLKALGDFISFSAQKEGEVTAKKYGLQNPAEAVAKSIEGILVQNYGMNQLTEKDAFSSDYILRVNTLKSEVHPNKGAMRYFASTDLINRASNKKEAGAICRVLSSSNTNYKHFFKHEKTELKESFENIEKACTIATSRRIFANAPK